MSRGQLALRVRVLSGLERYGHDGGIDDEGLVELASYIDGEVSVASNVLTAQRGSFIVHVALVEGTTQGTPSEVEDEEWMDEMEVDHDRG